MNEHQIFFAFILGTLLLTILTLSLGLFLFEHKKRQRANNARQMQLELNYRNELLKTRLEEQEKSMTLISEEIHDNIGQVLGLTKMYLHNALPYLKDAEAQNYGRMAEELITSAIGDLRNISHSLNSELLQRMGLVNALEREITFLQETTNMNCSFTVTGGRFDLAKERNVLLYRIVQEALQNAVKHSSARSLQLTLSYSQDELLICVIDDGKGFNVPEAWESNSLGLRSILNRANLLRAKLAIESTPEAGTTLTLSVPKL